MKITNITDTQPIPRTMVINLAHKSGGRSNVELKPGQFVYSEEGVQDNNSQLRIYERKGYVTIEEENKPNGVLYYNSYSELPEEEKITFSDEDKKAILAKVQEESLEKVEELHGVTVKEVEEDLSDAISEEVGEPIEVEVMVPESAIEKPKNKGGRPKGSKNKSKRGRPKKKNPVGRPKKKK